MSKYKKVGGVHHYDLYHGDNLVATIAKGTTPDDPDDHVLVTLPCGHKERFWMTNLTDEEYVDRAEFLKHNT